jgi:hypothetical protein
VTIDPSIGEDTPPLITVVRGEPTPDQLAALVAVVCSLRRIAGEEWEDPSPAVEDEPSLWGRPVMRTAPAAGPGAWRASGLPE